MGNLNLLENESIGRLLVKFSLPAIIGMVVNASYNVVDRIFVGRGVGPLALSGIAVTFPLLIVLMAFGMLVGIGASALVSIRLGEKNKEDAEKILGNAFTLIVIISAALTLAGILFMEPMLMSMGASGEVLRYAKEFMDILIWATLSQTLAFGLNNIIRAEGNPKTAMMTMIIGAALNMLLNPLFIFYLKLGVKGSALATLISTTVSAIWVLSYLSGRRSLLKLRIKNMILSKNTVKGILSIGVSPFALQLAASVIQVIALNSVERYGGDLGIAALGIVNSIFLMIFMPIFGINQGVQPIVGYNYGAGLYGRVKKALKLSIIAATTICTAAFFIIMLFSSEIMYLFTDDARLVQIGSHGLKIFLIMLPVTGFQIISSSYFQAVGKAKKAILLTLSRQVLLLIPLLLILPGIFRLNGVWMSGAISDFIASLMAAIFVFNELRHLSRETESARGLKPGLARMEK